HSAFQDCSGLTEITLPDSVTTIGEAAFLGCKGLKSIRLPGGLAEVPHQLVAYCEKLTSIYFNGTKQRWNSIMNTSEVHDYGTGDYTVYCTDGEIKK
ncbi:MAG: leucine-rich repeat protein, partial [Clostridia bacterium]|nr:leucine-rich repeat protein [Clostridia bacterium]